MVADDAGRILMIHRSDNDNWALPGGDSLEWQATLDRTAVTLTAMTPAPAAGPERSKQPST